MLVDDIVVCGESRESVEENLERWRHALESRAMKVIHVYNEREAAGTVSMEEVEVKEIQEI